MNRIILGFICLALAACGGTDETPTSLDQGVSADVGSAQDAGPDEGGADMDIAQGALEVEPSALDFGTAGVGSRTQLDVVMRNPGEGDLQITALAGLAAPFSVSRSLPLRIPAGAQRTVVVVFEPTEVGDFNQMVTVETDASGVSATLSLNGRVESADGRLQTAELNFGIVLPGESTSDFVVVENLSTATLTITAIDGLMPPFSVPDGQLPASGDSMAEARCLINFSPEAEGDYAQMVTVRTNAGDFTMSLVGRSLAPGAIVVQGVRPAWSPTDEAQSLRIIGGPFPEGQPRVLVGEVELENPSRVDEFTVTGTLPADGMAATGPQDVRVEFGPAFGRLTGRFIRTGPIADGQALQNAPTDPIGPEGNPWRFTGFTTEDAELTILPGTVLVADSDNAEFNVRGSATIGSRDGLVVFSKADRGEPMDSIHAWRGLRFNTQEERGTVLNTVVEYVGAGRAPGILIESGFIAFEGLTVQTPFPAGSGIQYESGSVSIVGALFDELELFAMRLDGADSVAQLSGTTVNNATPIIGPARLFGRLPLGAGHNWSRARSGIILDGETGTTRLANQPAGVTYQNNALTVTAGDTFTVPPSVPFQLAGPITVSAMGILAIPGGGQIDTATGNGAIIIEEGGELQLTASAEDRLTIGSEGESWNGITVAGRLSGGYLTLVGGSLALNADFGDLDGLALEQASGPLSVAGSGHLTALNFQSDEHGIVVSGGAGRLSGTVDSGGDLDVNFTDPTLCDAWDVSGLRRADNGALETNCP